LPESYLNPAERGPRRLCRNDFQLLKQISKKFDRNPKILKKLKIFIQKSLMSKKFPLFLLRYVIHKTSQETF
jgi:hypothetical protein